MVSPGTTTGTRRRGAMLLRGFGFALAVVLGGVAIWLIATSDTVKSQRIGALAGMWGVLIGAYAIFGARRHEDASHDAGGALEVRNDAALARSQDVAWQREFHARLEALLRREVQEGVSRELAGLRHEVASLRNEILEKVGGQLRMERTETTRLFGSNLEALQREVRLLKVAQLGDGGSISAIDVAAFESGSPQGMSTQSVTVERTEVSSTSLPPDPPRQSEPLHQPEFPRNAPRHVPEPEPPRGPWGEPEPRETESDSGFPPFRPLQPVRAFSSPGAEAVPQAPAASAAQAPVQFADSAPLPPYVATVPQADSAPLPPYVAPAPAADSGPLPPYALPPQNAPAPIYVPPAQPPSAPPTQPPSAPPTQPPSTPPTQPPDVPGPSSVRPDDPFASMPRIRPFTDFELDAVDRGTAPAQSEANPSGRHATGALQQPSPGGRRRRAEGSDNDVLAQILAREKPSSQQ